MKLLKYKFPILLVIFIFLFDFLSGTLAKEFYFSDISKEGDPLIYSMTSTKEELIVFGSSRAKHHYNPKILSDGLGISSYNFGSGGQNIYFHEIVLRNLLEFHKPKVIILELMTIDFQKTASQWDKDKLNVLIPFVSYSNAIDKEFEKIDKFHSFKTYLRLYPFNSQLYTILRNNFKPYKNHINGFIPINGNKWSKRIMADSSQVIEYDQQKIDRIFSFIEICQKNNIKVIISVSPVFAQFSKRNAYTEIIRRLDEKFGVKVYNFLNHPVFLTHPEYFNDPLHLNSKGADKFTEILVDSLGRNFQ